MRDSGDVQDLFWISYARWVYVRSLLIINKKVWVYVEVIAYNW